MLCQVKDYHMQENIVFVKGWKVYNIPLKEEKMSFYMQAREFKWWEEEVSSKIGERWVCQRSFLENKELQTNFLNFLWNMKPQDLEKTKTQTFLESASTQNSRLNWNLKNNGNQNTYVLQFAHN
jgi:hypothetical protein